MQIVGGPRSPASREGLPPPAGFFIPAAPGRARAFFSGDVVAETHTEGPPDNARAPAKTPLEIYRRSFPLLNSLSRSAKKRGDCEAGGGGGREAGRAQGAGGGEAGLEEKKLQRSPWKLHSAAAPSFLSLHASSILSLSSFLCAAILHQPSFGWRARVHLRVYSSLPSLAAL